MQHQLVKVDENGEINDESYRVNVRGAEIEQQKAMVAIVVSLFMYIAFILISAVGTILAVLFMFSGVCSIIRKDKARCENKKRGFFRKEWFSWQLVEKTQKEEN